MNRYEQLKRWVDTHTSHSGWTHTGVLHKSYERYCDVNDLEPLSLQPFGIALAFFMEIPRIRSSNSQLQLALTKDYEGADQDWQPVKQNRNAVADQPPSPHRRAARVRRLGGIFK